MKNDIMIITGFKKIFDNTKNELNIRGYEVINELEDTCMILAQGLDQLVNYTQETVPYFSESLKAIVCSEDVSIDISEYENRIAQLDVPIIIYKNEDSLVSELDKIPMYIR